MKNYYEILGVPRTAGYEEIVRAYKKIFVNYNASYKLPADLSMSQVKVAFETLSDTQKRQAYDIITFGTANPITSKPANFDDLFKVTQPVPLKGDEKSYFVVINDLTVSKEWFESYWQRSQINDYDQEQHKANNVTQSDDTVARGILKTIYYNFIMNPPGMYTIFESETDALQFKSQVKVDSTNVKADQISCFGIVEVKLSPTDLNPADEICIVHGSTTENISIDDEAYQVVGILGDIFAFTEEAYINLPFSAIHRIILQQEYAGVKERKNIRNVVENPVAFTALATDEPVSSQTNNKRLYLTAPVVNQTIKDAKVAAFAKLLDEINNSYSVQELYAIFTDVKNATEGILRKHQRNIIYEYGDTNSYRIALAAIRCRLDDFTLGMRSFSEITMIKEASDEAVRCGALKEHDKSTLKATAKAIFKKEVANQKTLQGVIDLFHQVTHPANILRFHQQNLIYPYGNTNSYKEALLEIAAKACEFEPATNEVKNLQVIVAELEAQKPWIKNEQWCDLIQTLKAKAKSNTQVYTSNQATMYKAKTYYGMP